MESQVIIYYPQTEDSLRLVVPSGEITVEEVQRKDVPSNVASKIIPRADLPAATLFFQAWEASIDNYKGVSVNMDKAKALFRVALDNKNAELSKPIADEYMRLFALRADTTAVEAQLQAINTAAESTDYLAAATVEALTACWPVELGANPFLPASAAV